MRRKYKRNKRLQDEIILHLRLDQEDVHEKLKSMHFFKFDSKEARTDRVKLENKHLKRINKRGNLFETYFFFC